MSLDESEAITFNRNELYEKIWSTPTIRWPGTLGFPMLRLGKICKKHSIPEPPLGYGPSSRTGKAVARPSLPSIDDQRLERIEIRKRPLFPAGPKLQPIEQEKEAPIAVPERLNLIASAREINN